MIILNRIPLMFSLTDASGVGLSHGYNFTSAFSINEKFSIEMVIPFQINTPVDIATLMSLKFCEPRKYDEKYNYALFPSFSN
jgi:hypothetical protein